MEGKNRMEFFKFEDTISEIAKKAEQLCNEEFKAIDENAYYNGQKVLSAYINNRVSEVSLKGSTGYGYGDSGRDTLDKVFAEAFGAQDALVRHNFVSGTHALSVALFGVLRTGDTLLSVTGKPYDTLEEVIGIDNNDNNGSLLDYGIKYDQVDLLQNGKADLENIKKKANNAKVCYIQRSRGYSLRPSFTVDEIGEIAAAAKSVNKDIIVMVDNCYGEFVDTKEPVQVGADLIVGSLIKNPGGAIASTGGYIAGRADLIEKCSYRLTCVGMGKEVGCTLNMNREMLLGFFMAPEIVSAALKTATFAARFFELCGYECFPKKQEKRSDIITAIKLGCEEKLIVFCQGIQMGAPVDSFVAPEPWDMPGYNSKVIMAAGTFTGGASIELSADAPLRDPFAVWMQGGITYTSGKTGVMLAAKKLFEKGLLFNN